MLDPSAPVEARTDAAKRLCETLTLDGCERLHAAARRAARARTTLRLERAGWSLTIGAAEEDFEVDEPSPIRRGPPMPRPGSRRALAKTAAVERLDRRIAALDAVLLTLAESAAAALTVADGDEAAEEVGVRLARGADDAAGVAALGVLPLPATRRAVLAMGTGRDPASRAAIADAIGVASAGTVDAAWADAAAKRLIELHDRGDARRQRALRAFDRVVARHAKALAAIGDPAVAALQRLAKGASANKAMKKLERLEAAAEKAMKARTEALRALEEHDVAARATFAALERLYAISPPGRASVAAVVAKAIAGARTDDASLALVEHAGACNEPAVGTALVGATQARHAVVRIAACRALARADWHAHVAAVAERLGDELWQVRIAAARSLAEIGGASSIDALVAAARRANGQPLVAINRALTALTGEDFHGNAALWASWWAKHRDGYSGPSKKRRGDAAADADAGRIAFYGVRTRSRNIAFVLDTSGSMAAGIDANALSWLLGEKPPESETKLALAKKELLTTLTALPDDAHFSIVAFSDGPEPFKRKPVVANEKNRRRATQWVETLVADGQTNIFDAVSLAIGDPDRLDAATPDTVFLLADGGCNRGDRPLPEDALAEIVRRCRRGNVTIHAIALGLDADVPFMRALATRTGGTFVSRRKAP